MKHLLQLFLIPFFCIGQIDYETEIQPIFDANCVSCHSNGATYTGGIELTSYDELMTGGYTTDNTNVLPTLVDYISTGYMPAGAADPLTESEIDLIVQWIAEGANPSNEGVLGCTDPEACNYDDSIMPGGFDDGSCQYPGYDCEGFDQQLQEIVYGYLDENCECVLPLSSIDLFLENKEIIKIVNVLGRKSQINSKEQILIYIYNDGSIERKYFLK